MSPGFSIRAVEERDIDEVPTLMLDVVEHDFTDRYHPLAHADIDDICGLYLGSEQPGPFLLAALDDTSSEIVGTCGVRGGALKEGLSPPHVVERYRDVPFWLSQGAELVHDDDSSAPRSMFYEMPVQPISLSA